MSRDRLPGGEPAIVRSVYTDGEERQGSAKQWAYEQIKQMVLTSAGSKIEFLGEVALAEELGVSRTPVREAFLRLEAEHLLQLVPGRGAFIPSVTEAEVAAVIEVRELFEIFAGRRLASAQPERRDVVEGVREIHEEQRQCLAQGEEQAVQFIFLDREFHRRIILSADNPVLADIYERLRDREMRMDAQARRKPGRLADAFAEHGAILTALQKGDPEESEAAIRTHLANTSLALR